MTANIGNEEISQHALELRESAKDLSEGKLAKKSDIAEGKDEHHNSGMEFRFITESAAKGGGMGKFKEYPTMNYFGLFSHTQTMTAYELLTEHNWEVWQKTCIVGMLYSYLICNNVTIDDCWYISRNPTLTT